MVPVIPTSRLGELSESQNWCLSTFTVLRDQCGAKIGLANPEIKVYIGALAITRWLWIQGRAHVNGLHNTSTEHLGRLSVLWEASRQPAQPRFIIYRKGVKSSLSPGRAMQHRVSRFQIVSNQLDIAIRYELSRYSSTSVAFVEDALCS
jgi:hypothetical protein